MKKILLITLIFTSVLSYAQQNMFSKDDKVVNLGVGFGSVLYSGSSYSTQIPPISASFEMGILDNVLDNGSIGVGGYVGFSSYKWESSSWGYNYTHLIFGGRGSFHYPLVDNLDTYAGVMAGFATVTSKEFGNSGINLNAPSIGGGIKMAMYIGARYYIANNLAVMAELGYGISFVNVGIALKL